MLPLASSWCLAYTTVDEPAGRQTGPEPRECEPRNFKA